jgi:hypothetical protein
MKETAVMSLALAQTNIQPININSIVIGSRMRPFDQETVDALAKDIKSRGLLQPIAVKAMEDGAFYLVYGHHRLLAFKQISEAFPTFDEIPATVWPSDTPDWKIQLAEIGENLCRKELTADERTEHMLRAAAIYKRERLCATVEERNAENGKLGGRGKVSKSDGASRSTAFEPMPTVAEKLSEDLGIDKKTAQRRVRTAAKKVGMSDVSLERSGPDALDKLANSIRESKEKEVNDPAPKVEKSTQQKPVTSGVDINPQLAKEILQLREENKLLANANFRFRNEMEKIIKKRVDDYVKETLDSDVRKKIKIADKTSYLTYQRFPLKSSEYATLIKALHPDTYGQEQLRKAAFELLLLNKDKLIELEQPVGPVPAREIPPIWDDTASWAELTEAAQRQRDLDRKIRQAAKFA